MITITCDMCGKKLNPLDGSVSVKFTDESVVIQLGNNFPDIERQLCIACATRANNWISYQLTEGGDN